MGRSSELPILCIASIGVVLPALTPAALLIGTTFVLVGLAISAVVRPRRR